eukprot:3753151-Prymnesium_polylepis.2
MTPHHLHQLPHCPPCRLLPPTSHVRCLGSLICGRSAAACVRRLQEAAIVHGLVPMAPSSWRMCSRTRSERSARVPCRLMNSLARDSSRHARTLSQSQLGSGLCLVSRADLHLSTPPTRAPESALAYRVARIISTSSSTAP